MNLQIFRVDGVPFVVSPYQTGIHIREDVFRSQLFVSCEGEIEYPEDDPIYGTYWMGAALDLGRCGLIEEAMALAAAAIQADRFDLGDDSEAISFSPEYIEIVDERRRLVLAGRVRGYKIDWCEPVLSNVEALQVRKKVGELRSEASFEMGWDNFSTARGLRKDARALGGRLVDACWRDHTRLAISTVAS